jgi:hypothetical protein
VTAAVNALIGAILIPQPSFFRPGKSHPYLTFGQRICGGLIVSPFFLPPA